MMTLRAFLEAFLAMSCGFVVSMVSATWNFPQLAAACGTLASLSGTLLGFVIAALAILATLTDKPLIKNMQKSGHYQDLLGDMFFSCALLGVSTIAGVAGLFHSGPVFLVCCLSTFVMASLRMLKAGQNFHTVLLHLH